MTLTESMVAQLDRYSDRAKIVTLRQWEVRGYDLGQYAVLLKGPSLARRAVNLTKAVTAHAANRFKNVPPKVAAERLATCETCPFFGLTKKGVCGHKDCGCPMGRKVNLASSYCPDKPRRWDRWEEDSVSHERGASGQRGEVPPASVDPVLNIDR